MRLSPQSPHIFFYKVLFDKDYSKPSRQTSVAELFKFPPDTHFFSDPPFLGLKVVLSKRKDREGTDTVSVFKQTDGNFLKNVWSVVVVGTCDQYPWTHWRHIM